MDVLGWVIAVKLIFVNVDDVVVIVNYIVVMNNVEVVAAYDTMVVLGNVIANIVDKNK